jgi:hypothetical protein
MCGMFLSEHPPTFLITGRTHGFPFSSRYAPTLFRQSIGFSKAPSVVIYVYRHTPKVDLLRVGVGRVFGGESEDAACCDQTFRRRNWEKERNNVGIRGETVSYQISPSTEENNSRVRWSEWDPLPKSCDRRHDRNGGRGR